MKNAVVLPVLLWIVWSGPAIAQMDRSMPGMTMPGDKPGSDVAKPKQQHKKKTKSGMSRAANTSSGRQRGHDMSSMPGMNMPGMKKPGTSKGRTSQIPQSPPPPPPTDHAADYYYDPVQMAMARRVSRVDNGGAAYSKVMLNLAEFQPYGEGSYRWDAQAWYGGDINRMVIKSEGDGSRRDGLEKAELQLLYSRAVAPYTDIQAGVRYDFRPNPSRTYFTAGVQTIFPYWFQFESALFISNKGELVGRVEGSYDLLLTQQLVLQPWVELNFAAQNSADIGVGSGLSDAELGLRLRYEIRREFAPYIGISYDQKVGNTAQYAKAAGKETGSTKFVLGIRTWF